MACVWNTPSRKEAGVQRNSRDLRGSCWAGRPSPFLACSTNPLASWLWFPPSSNRQCRSTSWVRRGLLLSPTARRHTRNGSYRLEGWDTSVRGRHQIKDRSLSSAEHDNGSDLGERCCSPPGHLSTTETSSFFTQRNGSRWHNGGGSHLFLSCHTVNKG